MLEKFIKITLITLFLWCISLCNTSAQSFYFSGFENISGNQYSLNTYNINGLNWESLEGLIGSSASDIKDGTKALRLRRNGGIHGYFKTLDNYTGGLGSLSFLYSRADFANDRTGNAPQLEIAYSIDAGQSWIAIDTINFSGIDTLHLYQSSFLNILQPIRIKMEVVGGDNGKRINIDNLQINNAYSNVSMLYHAPGGYGINAGMNQLQIVFSESIIKGDSGKIYVQEIGGNVQIYDILTATEISVSNDTAYINAVVLTAEKDYHVLFDSTIFKGINTQLFSKGIYDSTVWTFATHIQTKAGINDEFSDCGDGFIGSFIQESIKGDAQWTCDLYFYGNDPPFAKIMGGTPSRSFENEDYLISSLPVLIKDNAVLGKKVLLQFDEKRRYNGDSVVRGVYYSIDYSGDAGLAEWIRLGNNLDTLRTENQWQKTQMDITDEIPKDIAFHLAFKYQSKSAPTSTAYEWCIDNIRLFTTDAPVSVGNFTQNKIELAVLGNATFDLINVMVTLNQPTELNLALYNLQGKEIFRENKQFTSGSNLYTVNNLHLQSGMYILRAYTNESSISIKVVVAE